MSRFIDDIKHNGRPLREILAEHKKWVETDGKQGTQAILEGANLWGVSLAFANLTGAYLRGAYLRGADLGEADLGEANLRGANFGEADLRGANLTNTNFTEAKLTGIKMYGINRTAWKISGVKCDYVYLDEDGKKRFPERGDLKPGDFERLFTEWPTIELVFEHGLDPLDPFLLNYVALKIKGEHPETDIRLSGIVEGIGDQVIARFRVPTEEIKQACQEGVEQGFRLAQEQAREQTGMFLETFNTMFRELASKTSYAITGETVSLIGAYHVHPESEAEVLTTVTRVIEQALSGSDVHKELQALSESIKDRKDITKEEIAEAVKQAIAETDREKAGGVLEGLTTNLASSAILDGIKMVTLFLLSRPTM